VQVREELHAMPSPVEVVERLAGFVG